ncbi:neural proliferation differentiation and control protein 1-like isoform X1 [Nelusetta ayraudi]|uniref:neural proliferation differentiation and control protein 1-like isoform X1 n=2 Tax=Nelusetta ayraudi TaxID=303726 RepID=UPI003F70D018
MNNRTSTKHDRASKRWGNDKNWGATTTAPSVSRRRPPRMLLLPSPRTARLLRAAPLLLPAAAVLMLCCVPGSTGLPSPAHDRCSQLDCASLRRKFCKPGSSHCGHCLSGLVENEKGLCVTKKRHPQQDTQLFADLDDEIERLLVIAKQTVTNIKPAAAASPDARGSRTDASERRSGGDNNTTAATTTTSSSQPGATAEVGGRSGPVSVRTPKNGHVIIVVISVCVVVGSVAVIMASVCYVKLQKESRLAQKVDYPAYGGAGPPGAAVNGTSVGDKTLAQSAQMYHYQHRKQQMLSVGNHKPEQKALDSEATSDEEEVGGDFTVYECPGLAPTGEMEVKNPLFDDSTLHLQGNHK